MGVCCVGAVSGLFSTVGSHRADGQNPALPIIRNIP